MHRASVMSRICLNLRYFSVKHHAAIIIAGHPRKEQPQNEGRSWLSLDELMGSGAITAAVRSVFAIKDTGGPNRYFGCAKLTNGKKPPNRLFSIVDSTLSIGG